MGVKMKRRVWLWLFIALTALAWRESANGQRRSFLPESANFTGLTTRIPMRDGKTLAADLYLPKIGDKHPVVLIQTPYNKDLMLFVGGWFDIYTDSVISAFETVRAKGGEKARARSKLIVGPWIHGIDQALNGQLEFPEARLYAMKKTQAFFDHWLRQAPNGFDRQEPPISQICVEPE
jgi:predicted acyl esterase